MRAEQERRENELLVKEGDELTEEVYNRLRRQGIESIKVFASYTDANLRDELDAFERGERPEPRTLSHDAVDAEGEVIERGSQPRGAEDAGGEPVADPRQRLM